MVRRDLLIKGATILDPDRPLGVADIRIEGATIAEVGLDLGGGTAEIIDASGMIAAPGLINAHTHSGQNLDRGVAPNLPLDLWLIWVVYGGPGFSADDSYTLAMAGAVEMLKTGGTAVLDHAWVSPDGFEDHSEAMMTAYADAGIRAGLAPMIQDRDIFESMSFEGIDGEPPEPFADPLPPELFTEWMNGLFDQWHGTHPRLTPMVGPSAPQRCSDDLMRAMAQLTRERGAMFHTHVLETRTQIVATRERYGRSIVEFLADLDLMNSNTSLAHCVWMDPDEYTAVRDSGVTIVHNPVSNLRCGSGLLPLADLLEADVSVGVGADGAASNDNQNMYEALKFATLIHTLYGSHQRWPTAHDVWAMSLRGGAAAMGQPIGSIAPGRAADIALLDGNRPLAIDKESLAASLVLAEHGESVHTVVVGGEVVVSGGTMTSVDEAETTRRSLELQQRIHENLPDRQATFDRHADVLTEVHERAMAEPVGVERLAQISPAFGLD